MPSTQSVDQVDPEDWDEERLREECSELSRSLQRAEYNADKYDRRRKAYASAIAPLLRNVEIEDGRAVIPQAVWEGFTSDLAAISYGRIPEPRS